MGLGKMFADPNILGKLAANPRTQKHLSDPAFVQKVCPIHSILLAVLMTNFPVDSNDSEKSTSGRLVSLLLLMFFQWF